MWDVQNSIDYLVQQDTEESLAEALLVTLLNVKDSEGKLVRLGYEIPFEQRADYAKQIARMLRGGK